MEYADIGINILNIMRGIQYQIPNFITLSDLFQQLGRVRRDKSGIVIVMIFVI